jgi:hypothetical protein
MIRFKEDEDPNPNQGLNISYTLGCICRCIIKYSTRYLLFFVHVYLFIISSKKKK